MLNSFSLSAAKVWPDERAWDLEAVTMWARAGVFFLLPVIFPSALTERGGGGISSKGSECQSVYPCTEGSPGEAYSAG